MDVENPASPNLQKAEPAQHFPHRRCLSSIVAGSFGTCTGPSLTGTFQLLGSLKLLDLVGKNSERSEKNQSDDCLFCSDCCRTEAVHHGTDGDAPSLLSATRPKLFVSAAGVPCRVFGKAC